MSKKYKQSEEERIEEVYKLLKEATKLPKPPIWVDKEYEDDITRLSRKEFDKKYGWKGMGKKGLSLKQL